MFAGIAALIARANRICAAGLTFAAASTVIFLDEPTAGLDPEARIEVWQAVREFAEGGTTVLLTTQYLDEAEHLADRIAILHQGRIIVNGTLAELKQLLPPAKVEYVEKQPSLEDVRVTGGMAPRPSCPSSRSAPSPTLACRFLRSVRCSKPAHLPLPKRSGGSTATCASGSNGLRLAASRSRSSLPATAWCSRRR